MKIKYLITGVILLSCAANVVSSDDKKELNLDTQTEVDLLPGFTPCDGEKAENRFNNVNCQDEEAVESLSEKDGSTLHQVVEDDVQPEGNLLKKSFKPLVN